MVEDGSRHGSRREVSLPDNFPMRGTPSSHSKASEVNGQPVIRVP